MTTLLYCFLCSCVILFYFIVSFFYVFFFRSSLLFILFLFFFSSRRRHTRCLSDWSSDVCSSDLRSATGRNSRRRLCDGLGGGDVPDVEQDERIPLPVKTVKRLGVLLLRLGVHRAPPGQRNPKDVVANAGPASAICVAILVGRILLQKVKAFDR